MVAVIVAGAALTALLRTCAPDVAPSTMAAIVAVESGGNPYALNDNTAHRSYAPRDTTDAFETARALIRQGHSVDVGIAQVNSGNFAAFHTTAREMLDPCQNLQVASRILDDDYARSRARFPDPQAALWHAISAYNTGSLYAGAAYVERVVFAATSVPEVPAIAILRPAHTPSRPTPVVAPVASKPVPKIAKPKPADFAFARTNAATLIISSIPQHAVSASAK